MTLCRSLSKRIFSATNLATPSPLTSQATPHTPSPPPPPQNATKPHFQGSFFRRFLQRRDINNQSSTTPPLPSFLALPVGNKLREKLNSMNVIAGEQRLRVEGINPSLPTPVDHEGFRLGVADVSRVVRFVQMEKVRERLRNIPASTITHGELVGICGEVCGGDREMGLEFAKALDACGNVIVLGGVVLLRPDQVAKSMEKVISETIAMPNDPRRKELESLENQKALIDQKARSLVKGELYCGLSFWSLQTLGFMRLTFWELSWDVMEPICFFVTSLHFALAYAFFLRTSKEPSFEGYFRRRFRVKQKKLMKVHNFDVERYNQLCEVFYPYDGDQRWNKNVVEEHAKGAIFGSAHG